MEAKEMDDNLLIDKFLKGEQEGFEMLVKKYQNNVVNIVYSLAGQHHAAEDISQEVFMKVYNNLNSFNKQAKFSTWLYRITINATYNRLKKEKKYVPLQYVKHADGLEKVSLDKLEQEDKQELIRETIERLPFKYRAVLVLKEIEGLSYYDISKTLGCRIGTVESRLFRARNILRQILSPLLKEEE